MSFVQGIKFLTMRFHIRTMSLSRSQCLRLLITVIFLIYLGSPSLRTFTSQESVLHASETEEYAVYSAIINEREPGGLVVICDHTSPGFSGKLCMSGTFFSRRFPLVEETTIEDFLSKNEQSDPVENCFYVKCLHWKRQGALAGAG